MQLIGISYDSVDLLARFTQRRSISFDLLSDPGSATIKAWKLLNTEAKGRAEGVPHPMTYVLSKDGIIRAKLGLERYQDRHAVSELIAAAKSATQK